MLREDVHSIRGAMRGLQRFGESEDVNMLLRLLKAKIAELTENLIRQLVGKTLYELQCLGDSEQVRLLVTAWTPVIEQYNVEPRVEQSILALSGLEEAVLTAFYGLDGKKSRISIEDRIRSKISGHLLEDEHFEKELFGQQHFLGNLRIDCEGSTFCTHPSEMRI